MSSIPCWLWPVLAGLAGLLIGWLLRGTVIADLKRKLDERDRKIDDLITDKAEWETKWKKTDQDLSDKQKMYDNLDKEFSRIAIEKRELIKDNESKAAEIASFAAGGVAGAGASVDNSEELATLRRELEECRNHFSAAKADRDKWKALAESTPSASSGMAAVGAAAFAAGTSDGSKKDDLTKVEGIGPKINELLNTKNIWTFDDLANTSVEFIKQILDEAGPRYRVHNPATWPQQSAMARDGKWDELKAWQDKLDHGKE